MGEHMAGIRGKLVLSFSKRVSHRNTGASILDLLGFFVKSLDFLILA